MHAHRSVRGRRHSTRGSCEADTVNAVGFEGYLDAAIALMMERKGRYCLDPLAGGGAQPIIPREFRTESGGRGFTVLPADIDGDCAASAKTFDLAGRPHGRN